MDSSCKAFQYIKLTQLSFSISPGRLSVSPGPTKEEQRGIYLGTTPRHGQEKNMLNISNRSLRKYSNLDEMLHCATTLSGFLLGLAFQFGSL